MISLVFLLCLPNGFCQSAASEDVFTSKNACEVMAMVSVDANYEAMRQGLMPNHTITYKCIEWGEPL
jgi:hypothetical protein